jgi:hypothetical protein
LGLLPAWTKETATVGPAGLPGRARPPSNQVLLLPKARVYLRAAALSCFSPLLSIAVLCLVRGACGRLIRSGTHALASAIGPAIRCALA